MTGPIGVIPATVTAKPEFEQLLLEGFVGYRALDYMLGDGRIGVDGLLGARYNKIGAELSAQVAVLGLVTAADRERDEDWVDGVIGVRAQYDAGAGWGVSAWADFGKGA